MGSANINDRSQLGERDSEICLVVENEINDVETTMAGKQWNAGRFASSLRRQLYRGELFFRDIMASL
jgi:phospholipase D1/2